jgi:hypothetical protein
MQLIKIEAESYKQLKQIYNNEIEAVIKNLPIKKSPNQKESLLNSSRTLKKN